MKFAREVADEKLVEELKPLLAMHYNELCHPPFKDIQKLDPQYEKYLMMEKVGSLRVFTTRMDSGELVGYWCFFVTPCLHYRSTIQAAADVLFLHPDLRKVRTGFDFIKFCLDALTKEGVNIVHVYCKKAHDLWPIFGKLDFAEVDKHYSKRLN